MDLYWTYEELKLGFSKIGSIISAIYIEPMRNWNFFCKKKMLRKLIIYIEPMRNWNVWVWITISFFDGFILNLWGIETYQMNLYQLNDNVIYIEPMRNWNGGSKNIVCVSPGIYIEPMRNWNFKYDKKTSELSTFILNLWGIETIHNSFLFLLDCYLYWTYEELKPLQAH